MKEQKAITLVALVITIIMLLMLAGISIATLGGENGLLNRAKRAKMEHLRAEAKEAISLAVVEIQANHAPEEITLKTLEQELNSVNNKINPYKYNEGDEVLEGTYQSNKDTVFKFTIDKDFNVSIEGDSFLVTVTDVTSTSLTMSGNASSLGKIESYTYVVQYVEGENTPITIEDTKETKQVITGLTPGTEYKVYMVAKTKDGSEIKSNEQKVTTQLPDGSVEGAITWSSVTWSNKKASVEINTNTKYYIEYQIVAKDGTIAVDGEWTRGPTAGEKVTVSGLVDGDAVYARLTDGTKTGNYAMLNISFPTSLTAEEVSYTPSDTSWKVENVKQALDELYGSSY